MDRTLRRMAAARLREIEASARAMSDDRVLARECVRQAQAVLLTLVDDRALSSQFARIAALAEPSDAGSD